MNIWKIVSHLREVSQYSSETGSIPVSLKSIGDLAESIEQRHKDLMGLVERWRAREQEYGKRGTDDYAFGLSQAYEYAADDLESLINPKD